VNIACRRCALGVAGLSWINGRRSKELQTSVLAEHVWEACGEEITVAETIASILKIKGQETWSVAPDATVYDSIALMAEKGIGAVLVISERKLIGIISERDYARKIVLEGRSSRVTRVRDIMTADPVTASPENTVEECMTIMTQYRVRHLPVLDRENLVGIVSIGDLVKAVIAEQAHTIDQLQTYIGGNYPG
jgi:CBS domain-containing protein